VTSALASALFAAVKWIPNIEGLSGVSSPARPDDLLALTAQIVSAHVSNNRLDASELPGLITSVFQTISSVGAVPVEVEKQQPAVSVKKSVFPDYLICLEDGKKLKMLKRHLATSYQMTPDQYRHKWGLPANYPMVAPNYAEKRSSLAKSIGLGRKRVEVEVAQEVVAEPKRLGRPRKKAAA
jgi:predicted transcriptional regulator